MTLPALKENHKIYIMLALLIGASYLTYYYHVILGIEIVFTHLFYIPITLACIWWKWRGIVVALFLGAMLLVSHALFVSFFSLIHDVSRSLMFVAAAVVVALLSEQLERANILYRTVADSSHTGIYIIQNGKFRYLNRNTARHAGCTAEDMMMDPLTVVHPDDRKRVKENAFSMLKGKLSIPYEYRLIDKSSQIRYIMETITPIEYQGDRAVLGNVVDITDRKESEEALKIHNQRFFGVLNSLDALVYVTDMQTNELLFINKYGHDIWGDIEGKICWQTIQAGQTGPCEFCTNDRLVGPEGKPTDGVVWDFQNTVNGHWYECRDRAIYWPDGRIVRMEIATDVTARKRAEDALRLSEERYRTILRDIEDGYHEVDLAGSFIFFNESFSKIMGYSREELLGMNYKQYAADRDNAKKVREVYGGIYRTGEPVQGFDWDIIRKDGERRTVDVSVSLIRDAEGRPEGFRGIVRDITERKRQEEEAHKLSITDQLTGLYNRRGFIALAKQQMRTANRAKRHMMLAFIDIDGMKWINDALGHQEGDRALLDTTNVLRQTFRESDVIARIGGDEFAVLAIDVTDMTPEILSDRLAQLIAIHNTKETMSYQLSISWGVAIYDPDGLKSLDQLMSEADELMYLRKKAKLKSSV
ncbi:MAG: PAS domain S-box protein [Syntrophales bacterium]|nr:PAS domain S-box protein [Syntrophales bacterium]